MSTGFMVVQRKQRYKTMIGMINEDFEVFRYKVSSFIFFYLGDLRNVFFGTIAYPSNSNNIRTVLVPIFGLFPTLPNVTLSYGST